MKYSVESLISQKKEWNKEDFIFFGKIRHGLKINKSCLSPFFLSNFIIDDIDFQNISQYLLKCKMEKGNFWEIKERLKHLVSSREIGNFTREYKKYLPDLSQEEIYYYTSEGNFAKFTQNEDLRKFLLNTADKILVYTTIRDKNLGIGLDINSLDITNPLKWKGENILGFSLMEVRGKLQNSSYTPQLIEFEYYNEELSQVEPVLNIADSFIPPSTTIREEKLVNLSTSNENDLAKEEDYKWRIYETQQKILEKTPISYKIKQVLKENKDLFELEEVKEDLTYKDLEDIILFRNKVGARLFIDKSSWDSKKYTFKWYFFGKGYYEEHSFNVERIFDTYIEALERAFEEYTERAYKGKDERYYFKDIDGVYKKLMKN